MPIIVMQNSNPKTRCVSAIQMPPQNIQIILKTVVRQPPVMPGGRFSIFKPKGASDATPILKHCNPNGIPIIVIHSSNPLITYSKKIMKPPKIIQRRFPIKFLLNYLVVVF